MGPVIAAVVAATNGDPDATVRVNELLDGLAGSADWGRLVGVLRRILADERGDYLVEGLDPIDTAIVTRTLGALAGTVQLTATMDDLSSTPGLPIPDGWEPAIAAVVAAHARGPGRHRSG